MLKDLEELIGKQFSTTGAQEGGPDGLIVASGGACCIIVETQEEMGEGGCDPSIQAALVYAKYWTSDQVSESPQS